MHGEPTPEFSEVSLEIAFSARLEPIYAQDVGTSNWPCSLLMLHKLLGCGHQLNGRNRSCPVIPTVCWESRCPAELAGLKN